MSEYKINIDFSSYKSFEDLVKEIDESEEKKKIIISKNESFILNYACLYRLRRLLCVVKYKSNIEYLDRIEITIDSLSVKKLEIDFIKDKYNLIAIDFGLCSQEELFRNLIHLVKFYEIDKIYQLTREQMLAFRFIEFHKKNKEIFVPELREKDIFVEVPFYTSSELMGCYIKISKDPSDYLDYFNSINLPLDKDDENVICICKENILNTCSIINKNSEIIKEELLESIVYIHEFGHLVFSYYDTGNLTINEKQANYFCSFYFNSKYDYEIDEITKIQSSIYRDPILLSARYSDPLKYEEDVGKLYSHK